MADTVSLDQVVAWIRLLSERVTEQRAYLTELDSAIGDADHGSNLSRGFAAVVAKLDDAPPEAVGPALKTVGMTLVSTVGGASGPLYGTFFLQLGRAAGDAEVLDAAGLAAAMRSGLDGLASRGKASVGDKTMIDALDPAVAALEGAVASGATPAAAVRAAADAAAEGRDGTEPMVARKGRASYLGERSAGHLDPGAVSSTMLLEALADTLEG